MKFVLDTNICIRLLKGNSPQILKRIENIPNRDIVIPAIVRFELYYGSYKSEKKDETLKKLNDFLNFFDTIDIDNQVAEIAGIIRAELDKKGTPVGPYDLLIAASAIPERYTLVTHNTKEFSRIDGLVMEDWEE